MSTAPTAAPIATRARFSASSTLGDIRRYGATFLTYTVRFAGRTGGPAAGFGPDRRPLNLDEAVGEIVETAPTSAFEGYYNNDEATSARFRDGWYWSGDLAYRDAAGWLYFAGRSNEWLRVDGENFAAAPVESIIARHRDVRSVAVYAVPDDPVGDRVMAAIELRKGAPFDPVNDATFMLLLWHG